MAKHDFTKRIEGADEINGNSYSVNLYTREGGFVANVPVIPFQLPPEVIVWGVRTFIKTGAHIRKDESPFQYREGFSYTVPVGFNAEEYSKALEETGSFAEHGESPNRDGDGFA